jgi:tripartite ATP-independent transporter DctM subunit
MSIEAVTILLFASLILIIFSGLPIVFGMGGVGLIFAYFIMGPPSLGMLTTSVVGLTNNFSLLCIPMFLFMAYFLGRSGVIEDLYEMMQNWFGAARGGLAIGTVLICTIFAAMSGVSAAATVSMGLIAIPPMIKRNYNNRLTLGCVMAGGALSQLIPPSGMLIVYGIFAGESIGRLFLGGICPGLILSALFIIYIVVRCLLQPLFGPSVPPEDRAGWKQKFISLRAVILPLLIIVVVLGSIFSGMTTPTEASALGAFGSIVSAAIYRRLTLANLLQTLYDTTKTSCMILWLMFSGMAFAAIYNAIGAQQFIVGAIHGIGISPWIILAVMQLIWILLGCLMDANGIMFITIPVFLPAIKALGFSPLWFGVLWVVNMEMGFLTPPFGMNLFYMKAVAPKEVTMEEIYASITPFVFAQLIALVLCTIFPEIILWLPNLVMGR